MASTTIMSRNVEYGDFSFEDYTMRHDKLTRIFTKQNMSTRFPESLRYAGVIATHILLQLSYLQKKPIRFMGLPLEVRERVYHFIAMPRNAPTEASFHILLQCIDPTFYLNSKEITIPDNVHYHPRRKTDYLVSIVPDPASKIDAQDDNPEKEREVRTTIRSVRNLSNTSLQIRHELGSLIWRDVTINMDCWNYKSNLDFLLSRPGIWPGIRHLKLALVVRDDEYLREIQGGEANVTKFFTGLG